MLIFCDRMMSLIAMSHAQVDSRNFRRCSFFCFIGVDVSQIQREEGSAFISCIIEMRLDGFRSKLQECWHC